MKIGGVDPKTLKSEAVLVLPRGEDVIVFRACGLKDMSDFDTLCPAPKPPGKLTKDGYVSNESDPTYQEVLAEWARKRLGYMVVHSLAPSEIEWDTVNVDDPRTWASWDADLKEAGLSQIETNRVLGLVMEANSLDEEKLRQARDSFLRGQAQM